MRRQLPLEVLDHIVEFRTVRGDLGFRLLEVPGKRRRLGQGRGSLLRASSLCRRPLVAQSCFRFEELPAEIGGFDLNECPAHAVTVGYLQLSLRSRGVVAPECDRIAKETGRRLDGVVLNVPSTIQLLRGVPGFALGEDLTLAVRLASDRIVPHQKLNWEDPAVCECRLVTGGGDQIDPARTAFPGLDLHRIPGIGWLVVRIGRPHIALRHELVVSRPEIEQPEVDRVVTQLVHNANRLD